MSSSAGGSAALHRFDAAFAERAIAWMTARLRDGAPFGRTIEAADLRAGLGSPSVTAEGLGIEEAWRRFTEVVAPAHFDLGGDRFLGFIPASPSTTAAWMDAIISVACFSAESYVEGSGSVVAENEVLRWLADCAGMPSAAGGCFVSGGTVGNLSALTVAREQRRDRRGVIVADTAHSSVANALRLLDMPVITVPTDSEGRLRASAVRAAARTGRVGTIVASAGSTNCGAIDELDALADVRDEFDLWLHVDGAYGGAGVISERLRPRFDGIGRADSFILDPHKWLFAALGSCALLYRRPELAAAVHTQHASYLDSIHTDEPRWNPSDYAFQLTRRSSGLPIWFALGVHGADAHAAAIERGVELAVHAARRIESMAADGAPVELVLEPALSVVLFRRHGWSAAEWEQWRAGLERDGVAYVTPSKWRSEPVGRLVFMHPATTESLVDEILARLA